jgi:hypothetical protein
MPAKRKRKRPSFGKRLAKDPMRIGLVVSLWKRTVSELEKLKKKPGTKGYRVTINQVIREKREHGE